MRCTTGRGFCPSVSSTTAEELICKRRDRQYGAYRHKGKKVILQLSEKEFIRRFSLHILPKGFTRIRHYGILSSTNKKECKILTNAQLGSVRLPNPDKQTLHRICPLCKKGTLITISVFDERGPPIQWRSIVKI